MTRIFSLVGAVGVAALFAAACGDDAEVIPLQPASGGRGGVGLGGRGGTGGSATAGRGGTGGSATAGTGGSAAGGTGGNATAGTGGSGVVVDAGPGDEPDASPLADAGDAGPLIPCTAAGDCDDQNLCTTEACVGGFCRFTSQPIGTSCGDTVTVNECTTPDTCDANGVCLTNNQPDGTLCEDGHCSATGACDCAVERITAVPYNQQWQTTGSTETNLLDIEGCQLCAGTLDHIVVFTAPAAATYRFTATSLAGGVELTLFEGDCAADLTDPICNEEPGSPNQLELAIDAGATVTVVVGEQCEENGSEGALTIEVTPDG